MLPVNVADTCTQLSQLSKSNPSKRTTLWPLDYRSSLSPCPTWPNIFRIDHEILQFSDREQSETNRNDENAMGDYLSEYLRMCFRLHVDLPWPFLNILWTLCKKKRYPMINETNWEQFPRNAQIFHNIIWIIPFSFRQKRLPYRSVSDCSRLLNCLYRKQSGKYSARWNRFFKVQSHRKRRCHFDGAKHGALVLEHV